MPGTPDRISVSYIACLPVLHGLLYSLAACAVCRLRQPFVGGLAALAAFTLGLVIVNAIPATRPLDPFAVYDRLLSCEQTGALDLLTDDYLLTYGSLAALAAVAAGLAARQTAPLGRGRASSRDRAFAAATDPDNG